MEPAGQTSSDLATKLRFLRTEHWPDCNLTQAALANALGRVSPASIATWESRKSPKVPPREKVAAYAQFFATRRSIEFEPALLPLDSFTPDEHTAYQGLLAELLGLHTAARGGASPESFVAARRSWHFTDPGPLTIVCAQLPKETASAFADQDNPNYTRLAGFADLDAMVELLGHVRAENPSMGVFYKAALERRDQAAHRPK
jgi:hypothetical protein